MEAGAYRGQETGIGQARRLLAASLSPAMPWAKRATEKLLVAKERQVPITWIGSADQLLCNVYQERKKGCPSLQEQPFP